jgi:methyl-accepting chemotaxis protein
MFKNLSISRKLLITISGILILSIGMMCIYFAFRMSGLGDSITDITLGKKLQGDAKSTHFYLEKYYGKVELKDGALVDKDGSSIAGKYEMVDAIQNDLGDTATIFVKDGDDFKRIATNVKKPDGTRAVGTTLGKDSAAYASIIKGDSYAGDASILGKPYLTSYVPLKGSEGNVIGILYIGIPKEEAHRMASQSVKGTLIRGAIMGIIMTAVFVFLSIAFFRRVVVKPILRMVEALEDIAQGDGDITKRIEVLSQDEMGMMGLHYNTFVGKLHGTIETVARDSGTIASAAESLNANSNEMAKEAEKTLEQANSLAAATEEMSKTTSEIAQNCVIAAKSSEKTSEAATYGESVIKDTIGAMNRISEMVKASASTVENLGTQSQEIGKVVDLINDIADQTNLLALNAAIEAARAGEHGRGFAVVADEVRKLAEKTGDATKDIKVNVDAIQGQVGKTVETIEKGVTEVEIGTSDVIKLEASFKGMFEQINNVTEQVRQIAVASEEQSMATNDISASIQQIYSAVQEMAKKIEKNAMASSQFADMSGELQALTRQFVL